MKEAINTGAAPAAIGPYSQGVKAGDMVFVSGQIPLDPSGAPVEGSIGAKTERCLKNIAAILAESGLGLGDVVKTTVYMADLGQFAEMNEAYAKHFKAPYPARAAVQVSGLPKGVAIEIDAVAVKGG